MDYQKIKYIPIVVWMILILAFSVMPIEIPMEQKDDLLTLDNFAHFIFYFILTFMLLHIEFSNFKAGVISFSYGLIIEIIQLFLVYRLFSYVDLMANFVGIMTAIIVMRYIKSRAMRTY